MNDGRITHLTEEGDAHMVDVSAKAETVRKATAVAKVVMKAETLREITSQNIAKGDVFATARIAGIMAAKKTSDLIPLCHPLRLSKVLVDFEPSDLGENAELLIHVTVKARDRTGVEMEAMTAASVAALTIYDMVKAIDRWMSIESIQLLTKTGGKSGDLDRSKCEHGDQS